ncbi:multisubunit Na+/H+ antiporter, MnhF subunit [Saccharomonospora marina XMU15]|uniref:Multisubunit Na+/H+ antiporter, MnhF subunit n=1 Tax=Saccharomonospora marina XMU15 TaxID=882083 RepID=H5WWQ5_9PSEU|nr:monovalent cation/H+ antiporter complex subunit F [Saccharomonospora marina]EHR51668.1 multisubunit Na+/H+ antiporter, MnhF subunit [Saccharomonospora marina XMU15]
MSWVYFATFAMLAVGGVLTLWRMLRGPRSLDRVLALDMLLVLIIAGVTVGMAMTGRGLSLALLLSVSLLSFIGSISAVRLVERWESHR